MPRHIDSESRTDTVVGAINHILATDGIAALTLRRIGRVSGVSPPSILQHYGNREHLIRVAAFRTAKWRLRDIDRRRDTDGVLAFLPSDDDGIVEAREWLAWCELWRAEPSIARAMSDAGICLPDRPLPLPRAREILRRWTGSTETN